MNSLSTNLSTASTTATHRPSSEREKLKQAAQQFEAIFVRQMLAAARKTDFGGDLLAGGGMETFRQMQDEHFADLASQTGTLGLAATIEAQLARFLAPSTPAPSTKDA